MKFHIYRSRNGEWRWRLKARNGEIMASGEGYRSKSGARRAILRIQAYASEFPIVEDTARKT